MSRSGPQANSTCERMRRFFASNPHEELSAADMRVKFDCTERAAKMAIYHLRRHGYVIQCESVYRVVRIPQGKVP
jgi:hypothetical protein